MSMIDNGHLEALYGVQEGSEDIHPVQIGCRKTCWSSGRVPELMGLGRINVINDAALHCYRERPGGIVAKLTGDDKKKADANAEAARLWISGIEAAKKKLGVQTVYDLSATAYVLSRVRMG
ncbi:hypothetical protein GQA70_09900 [Ponticoccus alexandrii]|uniref:Uncharacterized protein n=1 Tax=Ponticoccus alexandrii TaxID=1943633 RepID=A0ABX7F7X4_9RHOB|nr:hypothetical protein [Ponticoccus alexandrii]QRF66589.1 hypothetical protein GQA70_09900 [Ponticoccus alexandrii]